jgi:hypothetical protein
VWRRGGKALSSLVRCIASRRQSSQ